MPIFDRRCTSCAWAKDDCYEPAVLEFACPNCHAKTERVWTASANVHGDDKYIGGLRLENMGHDEVVVYSRSEKKREMEKRGLREFVRHQPEQGSDRSRHTSRWI